MWAANYNGTQGTVTGVASSSVLRSIFYDDLRRYFALAGLSRSTTAPGDLVRGALERVFRVRVALERSVEDAISASARRIGIAAFEFGKAPLHGCSKKQGISIRMPLTSCVPTRLCGAACYAHDVLDSAPGAVLRGATNGAIAAWYEGADERGQKAVLTALSGALRRMVTAAHRDAEACAIRFERRPRIRFAHVGEFAHYPRFANALATYA